jgi:hypothetical protein
MGLAGNAAELIQGIARTVRELAFHNVVPSRLAVDKTVDKLTGARAGAR